MKNEQNKKIPKLEFTQDISEKDANINIDDLSDDFWNYVITKRYILLFLGFPLSTLWAIFIIYVDVKFNSILALPRELENIILVIGFTPIATAIGIFIRIRMQFRDSFYQQFADLNNLTFHRLGLGTSISKLGTIFNIFPGSVVLDVVVGKIADCEMKIYVYEPKVASVSSITIMEIDINFATILPNILLANKKGKLAGKLVSEFGQTESFTLEGNFNDYFNLYGNEQCSVEILQVFSPDLMQSIIDGSLEYSIELCGPTIFIYTNRVIKKRAQLNELLNFAKILTKEILPVANRLKNDTTIENNPIID